MNTVNLQIAIPEEIYTKLTNLKDNKSISQILAESLERKIISESDEFMDLLREGYLASNKEDREIIKDYADVDLEYWD